ncbi:MAG TPA: J domain-containing protein [Planctomycetota bacterium]|nr:J domain-containing protein [Planctomycetota bacterium]
MTFFFLIFTNGWLDALIICALLYVIFRRSAMRKAGRSVGRMKSGAPPIPPPPSSSSLPSGENSVDRDLRALDLKPGVNFDQIKHAYRELAKVWHPDRFGDDAKLRERANTKLGEINAAYERLKNHFEK